MVTTKQAAKKTTHLAWKATKSALSVKKNVARFNIFVLICALFFGPLFDSNWAHQSEEASDARNSRATRVVRWVSVGIWTGLVTWYAAFTPAFTRGYVGMATTGGWFVEWLFGWTLGIPLVGHLIAFTANLPLGALAPLGALLLWTIWANRITVSKKQRNPDPQPHTFTERYAQTPLFWLMFGFATVPAGLWLLLDGMQEPGFVADEIVPLVAVAAIAFAVAVSIIGALRIRNANTEDHQWWQQFDIKLNSALRLSADTLAAERAKPKNERKYWPKKMPDGSIQVILPPNAWKALSADNRAQLIADVAVYLPDYELGQVWDAGLILLPVTDAERTRRESLEATGGITDVPLGFTDPNDDGAWLEPALY